jgi:hypothetical protein
MESILELAGLHPEGESESGLRFECGGGRIGVEACGDRLTLYRGMAAWSHYLERGSIVEDLAKRYPAERTSPNATPVRDELHACMLNALLGGKRFAHLSRLQDDRAVVQLDGWSRARRVVFIRTMKPANPSAQDVFWGTDQEEVAAYVTSLPSEEASSGQIVMLYRKRADAEPTKGRQTAARQPVRAKAKLSQNLFDELKNQWGFSGFCSGKALVTEMAARLLLLTDN